MSQLNELFASPQVGAEGIELARGATIYAQGDAAEHLYFIHHGQVRLHQIGADGSERLVEILGPGQWFGCAALSDRGAYVTQATAATQAQLSRVTAAKLMQFVSQNPVAVVQMVQQLANVVQAAREEA